MRATVKFPAWQPDRAGTSGTFLAVADNVLPTPDGYGPIGSFVGLGTLLPSFPLEGAAFVDSAGLTRIFAGTATSLYTLIGNDWVSVGSGYSASFANPWSFEIFGQWVIATNGIDVPQYFPLETATAFTPLPGIDTTAPPRFKLTAIVANFLFAGVIDGNETTVAWSGINNPSEWRYGIGQSDLQPLADGGDVTAIAGGEYGLIFQSNSIRRATYVGGNTIFQLDVISPNIGCVTQGAFTQVGRQCFFWSARGFMVCDGSNVAPIGDEEVDRTFQAEADFGYIDRMSCVADPVRKIVYWTVPSAEPGAAYAYSWNAPAGRRWSRVVMPLRLLVAGRARDISLDEEAPPDDEFGDSGLSFDDPAYRGGAATFFAFNSENQIGTLTGPPAAARIGMGPLQFAGEGRETLARRWRVESDIVEGVTLTLESAQRLGDAPIVTMHPGPSASGDIVGRKRARSIKPTLDFAAGVVWRYANGLTCDFERAGHR